ncbi:unnamed protein product [Schistocephalus solidus]|uniref:Zinc finger and BTB domain-containing protein 24 n=1 Tax=Schistocephalus solidus TaxID=70667 RepID=A0A183T1G4_SCHSO|nr:unnamed protein product [Schistocephalus solidus]
MDFLIPGRQVRRYKDTLKTTLKQLQINPANREDLARNRPAWRRTVKTGTAVYETNRITAAKARRAARKSPAPQINTHCLSPAKPISKRVFPITSLEDYRSGETYSCPLCKRRFPGQISLKVHIETIHNGQRSATCEICEKRFSTLSYLRLHISTVHEGLKAYVCSICSKSYTQKHSLKKHVTTAHHHTTATKANGSQSGQTSLSSTATSLSPAAARSASTPSRVVKSGLPPEEDDQEGDEGKAEKDFEHQVLKSLATGSPETGIIRVPTSFTDNAHGDAGDVVNTTSPSSPASPAPPSSTKYSQSTANESPAWQSS